MSTSPFNTVLDDVNPDDDAKRRARIYLLAMRLTGQLDDDGMSEIGQALGLFACPEVDARAPPRTYQGRSPARRAGGTHIPARPAVRIRGCRRAPRASPRGAPPR